MSSWTTAPLVSARKYARSFQDGGDAHSIIRIKNLSSQALVGGAIWGGPNDDSHRNTFQPMLISCMLSLRDPFTSAAESDRVNNSTVNYSTLSKEILKVVASRRPDLPHSKDFQGLYMDWSLFDLIEWIQLRLSGYSPSGSRPPVHLVTGFLDGGCPCLVEKSSPAYKPPLLDIEKLLELGFRIFLPKATLLSNGVSLSTSSIYSPKGAYCSILKIHDIRIPTLIGVNKKERLAKQIVVVNVEVDPYICKERDFYNELEQIITKSTEESSFETLESLATHLSDRLIKYFIYAYTPYFGKPVFQMTAEPDHTTFSEVRICLEKPSAITFADAPSIEIIRSSDPSKNKDAGRLFREWLGYIKGKDALEARIPYPLQGTLSGWISLNCPGDST